MNSRGKFHYINTARIKPGICGFQTIVRICKDHKTGRYVTVESECEQALLLGRHLKKTRLVDMIQGPIDQNPVYQLASSCHIHPSCPVPCGIIKAVEVALGVALPKEVRIELKGDTLG